MCVYEGVTRSFRTGRLERELQMVQLSATRCSCIAILWISLVSFASITLCVASERVFIIVIPSLSWLPVILNYTESFWFVINNLSLIVYHAPGPRIHLSMMVKFLDGNWDCNTWPYCQLLCFQLSLWRDIEWFWVQKDSLSCPPQLPSTVNVRRQLWQRMFAMHTYPASA
jgi:hypothetical protein